MGRDSNNDGVICTFTFDFTISKAMILITVSQEWWLCWLWQWTCSKTCHQVLWKGVLTKLSHSLCLQQEPIIIFLLPRPSQFHSVYVWPHQEGLESPEELVSVWAASDAESGDQQQLPGLHIQQWLQASVVMINFQGYHSVFGWNSYSFNFYFPIWHPSGWIDRVNTPGWCQQVARWRSCCSCPRVFIISAPSPSPPVSVSCQLMSQWQSLASGRFSTFGPLPLVSSYTPSRPTWGGSTKW